MTLSREGDRLRKIFAEGAPDWLEEYTLKDLSAEQVIDLLDTQTFFELMNTPYPSDRVAVLDRLVRERLIDEINGTYAIRRLRWASSCPEVVSVPGFSAQGSESSRLLGNF